MDAVYDEFIAVERASIWEKLIKSPLMQRLRYIRQLGPCYLIYPCAEHTRFQHSIGVFWVAKKILNALSEKGYSVDEDKKNLILTAALVHDLGHSPYSHALEGEILPLSHEELTLEALKFLESEGVIEKQLLKDLLHFFSSEKGFAKQIIVSQLDADRLDYLRRDAFFTGVGFGRIDVNRIVMSAELYKNELVWSYRGFNALESYVMSRYHMYWGVYFHELTMSAQALLQSILQRARHVKAAMEVNLKKALVEGSLEHFFLTTDSSVIASVYSFIDSKDEILRDLSRRFVERKLFKVVEIENPEIVLFAKERLVELGYNPKYYMKIVEPQKVAYSYYSPKGEEPILVLKRDGSVDEISNIAPTDALKALSRRVKKALLIVPEELEF